MGGFVKIYNNLKVNSHKCVHSHQHSRGDLVRMSVSMHYGVGPDFCAVVLYLYFLYIPAATSAATKQIKLCVSYTLTLFGEQISLIIKKLSFCLPSSPGAMTGCLDIIQLPLQIASCPTVGQTPTRLS